MGTVPWTVREFLNGDDSDHCRLRYNARFVWVGFYINGMFYVRRMCGRIICNYFDNTLLMQKEAECAVFSPSNVIIVTSPCVNKVDVC